MEFIVYTINKKLSKIFEYYLILKNSDTICKNVGSIIKCLNKSIV